MWLSARESAQLQYLGIKSFFENLFSVNTDRFVMHSVLTPRKRVVLNEWRVGGIDFINVCLLDCACS